MIGISQIVIIAMQKVPNPARFLAGIPVPHSVIAISRNKLANHFKLILIALSQKSVNVLPYSAVVLYLIVQYHDALNRDLIYLAYLKQLGQADWLLTSLNQPPVIAVLTQGLTEFFCGSALSAL